MAGFGWVFEDCFGDPVDALTPLPIRWLPLQNDGMLIGLALSVAAPDSQAGRRLAWGKLRTGLGRRTEVFSGGDSNASVCEGRTFCFQELDARLALAQQL